MLGYTDKIRNVAKQLLESESVDMVIGFSKGTVPMVNKPCLVTNPKEASLLVWDSNCRINLANYLIDRKEKLAIIAKGCDSRNIVNLIIENKINRDQIYIIGVPCIGMLDRKKINHLVSESIINFSETNKTITLKTSKSEIKVDRSDVLQDNCSSCTCQNPVISDELIASNIVENTDYVNKSTEISKIDKMNPSEKWDYFDKAFSSCIRCYSCRNVCPLCYCHVCFVDESKPQWVGKGQNPVDIWTFHFMRAYHCAGRCTDCGACEQSCPTGINMRVLTKKLALECKELFEWESGLSLKARPVLDTYRPDDPEDFIK